MEIRRYGNQRILIADNNKGIRGIDDIYTPATEEHEEHFPYYASIIFLADNFEVNKLHELYIEEELNMPEKWGEE